MDWIWILDFYFINNIFLSWKLQRLRYISPNLFLYIISVVDSDSTVTNSPPRNELNSKDSSTSDISSSCSETQSDVINKVSSLYYVSIFLDFFSPTHSPMSAYVNSTEHQQSCHFSDLCKIAIFLTPPTQSLCWRNIGMVPKEQTKQKPQPPPKPKMLVTQDGRLKPVPPPRPTKAS